MTCEEIKTEKYQTRKSPPFHAKDCKDHVKKGKDGDYISKPDSKGTYKWIKHTTRKLTKVKKAGKSYLVHDNGGRPFRVHVYGKEIEIYKGLTVYHEDGSIDWDTIDYSELVKKLAVEEVHLGHSPCNSKLYIRDACGASEKGNSILLHVSGHKYMYIGHMIYEFTMEDEFEAYYSVIGNNDVPYPVVLGSNYVYFMLDHTRLPRELFKANMNSAEWSDAYAYYFGFKDYTTGELIKCPERLSEKEREKCRKSRDMDLKKINKANEKPMKGFKIIRDR
jgi:hypothetical protein